MNTWRHILSAFFYKNFKDVSNLKEAKKTPMVSWTVHFHHCYLLASLSTRFWRLLGCDLSEITVHSGSSGSSTSDRVSLARGEPSWHAADVLATRSLPMFCVVWVSTRCGWNGVCTDFCWLLSLSVVNMALYSSSVRGNARLSQGETLKCSGFSCPICDWDLRSSLWEAERLRLRLPRDEPEPLLRRLGPKPWSNLMAEPRDPVWFSSREGGGSGKGLPRSEEGRDGVAALSPPPSRASDWLVSRVALSAPCPELAMLSVRLPRRRGLAAGTVL